MSSPTPTTDRATTPLDVLTRGAAIPAHPLALTADRTLDERRQRALTRYYLAAGAGGLAVAVHTTQFEIRNPGVDLLRPVLELTAETVRAEADRPVALVAGVCGYTAQAVAEAELAAELGYTAVLLSPKAPGADEKGLLDRAKAVGEVLPVIGFYLQDAVGGHYLSPAFWTALTDQPSTVAIKIAPFDRYRTADVLRAVTTADRANDITLYTGNDDDIIGDLLTPYTTHTGHQHWIAGGLLGQWAIWTRAAVTLLHDIQRARTGDHQALVRCLTRRPQWTDANSAVFDVLGGFRGCIPGVHEVLRRQGLLTGTWCLDPDETLSPGQADALTRVSTAYPWLTDDDFIKEHLDDWLR